MKPLLTIVTSAYRSTNYLHSYFENMLSLDGFREYQLILVLNDPNEKDLGICKSYRSRYPDNFHYLAVSRESIGRSINRGFRLSDAEVLTYADVDDLREPDCYRRQLRTLEEDPATDFTYGDFVVVDCYGSRTGKVVRTAQFDEKEFVRSSAVGPNHVFRRRLLDRCGPWDEQFRSGGDFEFQARAALSGNFTKTEGDPLLYYTFVEGSASKNRLQPVERTVIELRYGSYDKIDYEFLPEAMEYSVPYGLWDDSWHRLSELLPRYNAHITACRQGWLSNEVQNKSRRKKSIVLEWLRGRFAQQRLHG